MPPDCPIPPYSEEAERGVLGSLILDAPRVMVLCAAAGLTSTWFYVPAHQPLFAALSAMRPDRIDLLTVGDELKARGTLERIGGHSFLERLVDATPTPAHAEYYLGIVADQYRRRLLMQAARQTLADVAGDTPLEAILEQQTELQRQLSAQTAAGTRAVDAAHMVQSVPPAVDPILGELFDRGDKVPIIGSSKARKSFFALQLALTLASGRTTFLRWQLARPRRVLILQFEVKEAHYHRRVHHLAQALQLTAADLGDRLAVASLRGHECPPSLILTLARRHKTEVIIIDPLYKLATGDENLAADMKPLLAFFDQLAEETGAAVLYVHHNPKGTAGDREARDRGAGSGVIARDFDACIYLTEHRDYGPVSEWLVVETLLRNYAPQEPFVIGWDEGHFSVEDGVEPVVKTSANRNKKGRSSSAPDTTEALTLFSGAPLTGAESILRIRGLGFSDRDARLIRSVLIENKKIEAYTPPAVPRSIFYGSPAAIAHLKNECRNPMLKERA
ncbi:MAG: AAA family ATPase [Kiritimatiellaeota bacterium]|nr:AAA family ATPase [Kiritimatiellota bacterium]